MLLRAGERSAKIFDCGFVATATFSTLPSTDFGRCWSDELEPCFSNAAVRSMCVCVGDGKAVEPVEDLLGMSSESDIVGTEKM